MLRYDLAHPLSANCSTVVRILPVDLEHGFAALVGNADNVDGCFHSTWACAPHLHRTHKLSPQRFVHFYDARVRKTYEHVNDGDSTNAAVRVYERPQSGCVNELCGPPTEAIVTTCHIKANTWASQGWAAGVIAGSSDAPQARTLQLLGMGRTPTASPIIPIRSVAIRWNTSWATFRLKPPLVTQSVMESGSRRSFSSSCARDGSCG